MNNKKSTSLKYQQIEEELKQLILEEKIMIKDRIIPIIEERESVDSWDYGIEQCHKKLIALITEDIDKSIDFLDNDCTADQFSWLSEVFDEIAEITKSQAFIEALKRLAIKYPEETKEYNIESFIESAECIVEQSTQ